MSSGPSRLVEEMERKFEDLVEAIEESFLERGVSVVNMQRSIKHMRMSLKRQLADCFYEYVSHIFKLDSIEKMFAFFSSSWDYLNPGLLEFIVGKFGSENDIDLMRTYLSRLEVFRKAVKLGQFVHTRSRTRRHSFYQNIVSVMGDNWEEKSLQDLENYKNGFANELELQRYLTLIDAERSSIAIVFSIPHWIQINFEQLEPFFRSNGAIKVYHGDSCVFDLTKQVGQAVLGHVHCVMQRQQYCSEL